MKNRFRNMVLGFLGVLVSFSGLYVYKMMSLLMPLFAILAFAAHKKENLKRLKHPSIPFIILFILMGWGCMAPVIFPLPHLFYKDMVTSLVSFLCFYVLLSSVTQAPESLREQVRFLLKISLICLVGLMSFQLILDKNHLFMLNRFFQGPYMMKPSGSILGLFLFIAPAYLWIYHQRFWAVMTFLVFAGLIVLTQCQTAVYGLMMGSLLFLGSLVFPRLLTSLIALGTIVFLAFMPLFHLYVIPLSFMSHIQWVQANRSFYHRLLGWDFLVNKFKEAPFTGWGFGSSRFLPMTFELEPGFPHLIHPHNGALQSYVEFGIFGGLTYACLWGSLFWLIRQHVKGRLSVAVGNGTLIFLLVQVQVTQNLWHNYWISWLALAGAVFFIFLQDSGELQPAQDDR